MSKIFNYMYFLISQASNKKFLGIIKSIFQKPEIKKLNMAKKEIEDLENRKTGFNCHLNTRRANIRLACQEDSSVHPENVFITTGFYSESGFIQKRLFIQNQIHASSVKH
ncbi:hypothetical protein [Methanosarcina barkeri]|uniref:Uncharacterized protein n=1 Tax=Methanosarcina barkeri CM1 TaxID=796385 RepID=A0A0G3C9I2_METBA|nr:hypothetical protein [Methanosarcina barkeri]AKJ38651.1 hypothetical protein MCM1_1613 [Methanosarcina barkeri CM1]